jgi:myo-inositol 2-dehydrogenase/D-chiro-inositol 1-dehydrogenase
MDPVRVGIIGTSWGRVHVGTVRACGAEVAVIVGRDAEKTRRVAAEERIAIGSTDLAALDEVDVVIIASATPSHEALIARFAHKPVICEKPLLPAAPSSSTARRISGARVLVSYAFAFLPEARELAARVRTGELGTVERVELSVGVSLGERGSAEHWLLDVGSHPVSWLSGLFGAFRRVALAHEGLQACTARLENERTGIDLSVGPASRPGIEYAIVLHGSRHRGVLDGVYRVGDRWSFGASLDAVPISVPGAPPHDPWYAANCACVAAALGAFFGGPRDHLVDGASALALEAALWPTRS